MSKPTGGPVAAGGGEKKQSTSPSPSVRTPSVTPLPQPPPHKPPPSQPSPSQLQPTIPKLSKTKKTPHLSPSLSLKTVDKPHLTNKEQTDIKTSGSSPANVSLTSPPPPSPSIPPVIHTESKKTPKGTAITITITTTTGPPNAPKVNVQTKNIVIDNAESSQNIKLTAFDKEQHQPSSQPQRSQSQLGAVESGISVGNNANGGGGANLAAGLAVGGLDEQQNRSQLVEEQSSTADLSTLPTDVYQSSDTETAEQIVEARGYVLQEKLGSGAFATVYKAWHLSEQFYAACKVIEMRKKKRKRLNDLKHELYVLERMDHAHIVKLYEHFIIDERVYIFMECASGGTLSEHVRKRGPLRELRARRWFKQICSAVHHMHTRGISHRDLKLGNILLDEQRQCKVTDFGLSRVSYRPNQGVLYCTSYCGTEPYMAPEILKKDDLGKRCYDPLIADIWALGVCLYAMVNKAYPFNPEDKETMVSNQLQRKWKFVKKQRYRLSPEVKDLVRHMLEPDPKRRITFLGIASHPWMTDQLTDGGSGSSRGEGEQRRTGGGGGGKGTAKTTTAGGVSSSKATGEKKEQTKQEHVSLGRNKTTPASMIGTMVASVMDNKKKTKENREHRKGEQKKVR